MSESFYGARGEVDGFYLLHADPQVVYDWLEANHPEPVGPHGLPTPMPEDFLRPLLSRDHPLVNLGIARFTNNREILELLYSDGNPAIKCAVLSSSHFGEVFAPLFGRFDFFASPEDQLRFLTTSSDSMLEALLSNPSVPLELLESTFKRAGAFAEIPDDLWMQTVGFALRNERLYEGALDTDGGPDSQGRSAIKAAWALLDTEPAEKAWARGLETYLRRLPYEGAPRPLPPSPGDDFLTDIRERSHSAELEFFRDVFQKWKKDDEDPEATLNSFGELRRAVAAKAPRTNEALRELIREHADVFVRQGYYDSFHPHRADTVDALYEKDQEAFLEAAIENPRFYEETCSKQIKLALHRSVEKHQDAAKRDDYDYLSARYNNVAERLGGDDYFDFLWEDLSATTSNDDTSKHVLTDGDVEAVAARVLSHVRKEAKGWWWLFVWFVVFWAVVTWIGRLLF